MSDVPLAWLTALESMPRLGWAAADPVVEPAAALAQQGGWADLWVVRDDQTRPLSGGTKVRKLDYLLAAAPFAQAESWTTVGAIGSGHLVACTEAAQLLGRQLRAHIFWEPLSAGVVDNLAYTVSHAADCRFHGGRVALAMRAPSVLTRAWSGGAAVIPPGGTHPLAMVGLVRAGLQFAVQVGAGQVPRPDAVFVSFGSGGTAVGLAAGLALGGWTGPVCAVLAVEPWLAPRARVVALRRSLARQLAAVAPGLPLAPPCPIEIDPRQVGTGYGWPTPASLAAAQRARDHGFPAEAVYTGKVLAALWNPAADPSQRRGKTALFWDTVRRQDPLARKEGWQQRIPDWLRVRIDPGQPRPRRWFLGAAGVGLTATAIAGRRASVALIGPWRGEVLTAFEATTLHAACVALLWDRPAAAAGEWLWRPAVEAIDRYVAHLPRTLRGEVSLLCACVSESTVAMGHSRCFAAMELANQLPYLDWLYRQGGVLADAKLALEGLVMLGAYQLPEHWAAIGYEGPMVGERARPPRHSWDRLHAPPGALPPGLLSP
ncbi:MAG: pyridoxal-phosphate dependent enzyme [Deltaproteobacteria bacterium]|nr:pyridoxal-phosphate dependent enzyme [Deltaproteobacteria bacterium]